MHANIPHAVCEFAWEPLQTELDWLGVPVHGSKRVRHHCAGGEVVHRVRVLHLYTVLIRAHHHRFVWVLRVLWVLWVLLLRLHHVRVLLVWMVLRVLRVLWLQHRRITHSGECGGAGREGGREGEKKRQRQRDRRESARAREREREREEREQEGKVTEHIGLEEVRFVCTLPKPGPSSAGVEPKKGGSKNQEIQPDRRRKPVFVLGWAVQL